VHTAPGDSNFWYLLAVGMGVGLLFAAISWYLLEKPLARYKGALDGALGGRRVPR
jgi:peptidoglycan/LPS O-acetylase OafA/YrhL